MLRKANGSFFGQQGFSILMYCLKRFCKSVVVKKMTYMTQLPLENELRNSDVIDVIRNDSIIYYIIYTLGAKDETFCFVVCKYIYILENTMAKYR